MTVRDVVEVWPALNNADGLAVELSVCIDGAPEEFGNGRNRIGFPHLGRAVDKSIQALKDRLSRSTQALSSEYAKGARELHVCGDELLAGAAAGALALRLNLDPIHLRVTRVGEEGTSSGQPRSAPPETLSATARSAVRWLESEASLDAVRNRLLGLAQAADSARDTEGVLVELASPDTTYLFELITALAGRSVVSSAEDTLRPEWVATRFTLSGRRQEPSATIEFHDPESIREASRTLGKVYLSLLLAKKDAESNKSLGEVLERAISSLTEVQNEGRSSSPCLPIQGNLVPAVRTIALCQTAFALPEDLTLTVWLGLPEPPEALDHAGRRQSSAAVTIHVKSPLPSRGDEEPGLECRQESASTLLPLKVWTAAMAVRWASSAAHHSAPPQVARLLDVVELKLPPQMPIGEWQAAWQRPLSGLVPLFLYCAGAQTLRSYLVNLPAVRNRRRSDLHREAAQQIDHALRHLELERDALQGRHDRSREAEQEAAEHEEVVRRSLDRVREAQIDLESSITQPIGSLRRRAASSLDAVRLPSPAQIRAAQAKSRDTGMKTTEQAMEFALASHVDDHLRAQALRCLDDACERIASQLAEAISPAVPETASLSAKADAVRTELRSVVAGAAAYRDRFNSPSGLHHEADIDKHLVGRASAVKAALLLQLEGAALRMTADLVEEAMRLVTNAQPPRRDTVSPPDIARLDPQGLRQRMGELDHKLDALRALRVSLQPDPVTPTSAPIEP